MLKLQSHVLEQQLPWQSPRQGPPKLLGRALPRPLWEVFQAGQMLELSGRAPGKLSAVVRLIARAQAEGEPVAWVSERAGSSFYPPDFARAGVDLAALVVVRIDGAQAASSKIDSADKALAQLERPKSPERRGAHEVLRAAEVLLRSGAFGLVVIDFSSEASSVPKGELSWQARLSGLARHHAARIVFLTRSQRHEASLGPMVSLRIEPSWQESAGNRALLSHQLIKSKLGVVAVSPDTRSLPEGADRPSPC